MEAAEQGVRVEEGAVSSLMFANDVVGISETPEALHKQIEEALEYTRKWRVIASVNRCVVLEHEDTENPEDFNENLGEEEWLIFGHYACLGVEMNKTALGMHT